MIVSWNVQVATWTANNRYPGIFRTVRRRISAKMGPDLGEEKLRILSFGCSTGSEVSTLRSYFPDATIYGCDINESALKAASEVLFLDEAMLFKSSPEKIAKYGPFDIIFAMSVLCRFPESMELRSENLNSIYQFSDFERTVNVLTQSLRKGGILCLYNTNYSFLHLPISKSFRIVRSPLIGTSGFVDRFDASGTRLTRCEQLGPYYVHRIHQPQDFDDAFDFTASIFEEDGKETADIYIPFSTEKEITSFTPPKFFRFGPDLNVCAQKGLVATALGYWFEDGVDGHHVIRAWHRTTPSGQVQQGQSWAVKSDVGGRDALSADSELNLETTPQPVRLNRVFRTVRSVKRRIYARLS
jgi:SAM-dependent methyltransferase